jgi:hypothetical protein
MEQASADRFPAVIPRIRCEISNFPAVDKKFRAGGT